MFTMLTGVQRLFTTVIYQGVTIAPTLFAQVDIADAGGTESAGGMFKLALVVAFSTMFFVGSVETGLAAIVGQIVTVAPVFLASHYCAASIRTTVNGCAVKVADIVATAAVIWVNISIGFTPWFFRTIPHGRRTIAD